MIYPFDCYLDSYLCVVVGPPLNLPNGHLSKTLSLLENEDPPTCCLYLSDDVEQVRCKIKLYIRMLMLAYLQRSNIEIQQAKKHGFRACSNHHITVRLKNPLS